MNAFWQYPSPLSRSHSSLDQSEGWFLKGKEVIPSLTTHEENMTSCIFSWSQLLFKSEHNFSKQAKMCRSDFFPFSCLIWSEVNFPCNSLAVRFPKSLFNSNTSHSPFIYQLATTPPWYQGGTLSHLYSNLHIQISNVIIWSFYFAN